MSPQRVLITAGASGIGLALARRFAARGDQVAICDVDADAVKAVQADYPDFIALQTDVSDEAQMQAFLDHVESAWGGIDVVCANAGTGGPAGNIETLDYADWQACVAVNLHGAFLTCRWAARLMRAQGAGLIVLTSSTAGLMGFPLRSPYCASKWGIIGLTKTLACELGPAGVRVNAICPGPVTGDRIDRVIAKQAKAGGRPESEVRDSFVNGLSMGEWIEGDDLADTVLFLASPAARKISGQIIAIDGHTETLGT